MPKSENKDHKKYYDSFLKTDESTIKHLISQICVIDGASDIIDVEKNFRKQIRYSCIPKYENQICERLEGWWYKKAIEAFVQTLQYLLPKAKLDRSLYL